MVGTQQDRAEQTAEGDKGMKSYSGNITPEPDTIFVFGSNPEGRHGLGSAKVAVEQFGAIYGQGEGLQGSAYALPTTELRYQFREGYRANEPHYYRTSMSEEHIIENIKRMYECAEDHPDKKFKVAYRNQPSERTLCGYSGRELMAMFKKARNGDYPDNVYFSEEWINSGLL